MNRSKLLLGGLVLLFLIGVAVALSQLGDAGNREVVNQYRSAVFGITYPLGLEIEEYPNGSLSIGAPATGGFDSAVDLTVVTPADGTTLEDFDTYLRAQVQGLCAADAPSEQVSCATIERERTVRNAKGETAKEYQLTLTRTRAGQEPQTLSFGPIYAYVLPPIDEDAPNRYSALLVHAPVPDVLNGNPDLELLGRINDSLTVGHSRR
ncbi:MAG TPA: hypothetical protein VEA36_00185 [Candidatus Paceibacterota bacterium]|nr:hypothetical protein [Candidatus Paceibacterota bacterium]